MDLNDDLLVLMDNIYTVYGCMFIWAKEQIYLSHQGWVIYKAFLHIFVFLTIRIWCIHAELAL